MLGGADNPNGELPSYITGADSASFVIRHVVLLQKNSPGNYRYGDVRIKRALFP